MSQSCIWLFFCLFVVYMQATQFLQQSFRHLFCFVSIFHTEYLFGIYFLVCCLFVFFLPYFLSLIEVHSCNLCLNVHSCLLSHSFLFLVFFSSPIWMPLFICAFRKDYRSSLDQFPIMQASEYSLNPCKNRFSTHCEARTLFKTWKYFLQMTLLLYINLSEFSNVNRCHFLWGSIGIYNGTNRRWT